MRTVITHFYNESYMLPWWLKHHLPMFDHGILIDYGSTDGSADICRALAPDWRLVRSANPDFSALDVDFEVMQYETGLPGWKIALNTTEFLCMPDAPTVERLLVDAGAQGGWAAGLLMIDPFDDQPPSPTAPLLAQKHHGVPAREVACDFICPTRDRLYHRARFGAYEPGRHASRIPLQRYLHGVYVAWFGFSPWSQPFVQRKFQVQNRIPALDLAAGFGDHHFADMALLAARRDQLLPQARDLRPLLGMG